MHPVKHKGWTPEEIALAERLGAEVQRNILNLMRSGSAMAVAFRLEADRTLVEWQIYPRKIRDEADRIGFSQPAVEAALAEAHSPPPMEFSTIHPPQPNQAPAGLLRRFLRWFSMWRRFT